MSDLKEFFKVIAEEKQRLQSIEDAKQNKIKQISSKITQDVFESLSVKKEPIKEAVQEPEPIMEEVVVEPVEPQTLQQKTIDYIKTEPKQKIVEATSVDKQIADLRSHISQLALGMQGLGGGGEVNLRWLDDVNRSTIADGRWLKYDGATEKFVFDDINPFEVVHNTTLVTTPTYEIVDNDYYIGVDYAGAVSITLPSSPNSGRVIVIKDESGDASTNPITVTGTVDNDAGGFILQLDNGGVQLIYRDGWRII